jgi:hypothetical protein
MIGLCRTRVIKSSYVRHAEFILQPGHMYIVQGSVQ